MEEKNKIVVVSESDLIRLLNPLLQKIDHLEKLLLENNSKTDTIYTDSQAAKYLKVSTKKLQHLRNERKIGFIREDGGRKILYKHEHLMEYLNEHELKKKK